MRSILLALPLLLLASTSPAADIYVPDDFALIQQAIDAASAADHVFVRAGTYSETITLKDSVDVTGIDGAASTIIDGGGSGRTVDASGVALGFSGFTVTGGDAPTNGGGMGIGQASVVTVDHCVFTTNIAAGTGGGMTIQDSQATIVACEFDLNMASGGGGLFVEGAAPGAVVIDGCDIHDNTTTGPGAGLQAANGAVTLTGCTLHSNTAGGIGGGISLDGVTCEISGCAFYLNAASDGGGISFHNISNGNLAGTTFYMNSAPSPNAGGISCTNDSRPDLRRLLVARSTDGKGIRCLGGSLPTVTCCLFFGNSGGDDICGVATSNVFVDPEFCLLAPEVTGDFRIQSDSPCTASSAPCGELIGRDGVGCGVDPVAASSWGGIKSIYR